MRSDYQENLGITTSLSKTVIMMEKTEYADHKEEPGTIPKNIFKTSFTWYCYEAARSYVPAAQLVWLGGLLLALRAVDFFAHFGWAIGLLMTFVVSIVWTPLIFMLCRKVSMNRLISKNVDGLAKAVEDTFSVEQEALALGWNAVASRMNQEFYLEKKWKTPYCLFDGVECESYFRQNILKSTFDEKLSNVSEKSDLRTAADIYQQRVVDQFNGAKKDTLRAEDTLPRDFYWSKATWRILQSVRNSKALKVMLVVFLLLTAINPIQVFMQLVFWLGGASIGYPLKLTMPSENTTRDQIRLLATIGQVEPRNDMDRWDDVAKRINAYLNEAPSSLGTDRFFDGQDCCKYFEKHIRPFMRGKCNNSLGVAYELIPLISEVDGDSPV